MGYQLVTTDVLRTASVSEDGDLVITLPDNSQINAGTVRGLPGVNAVENDEAVAAYLQMTSSVTRQEAEKLFPVLRVWDGTTYPPRYPNGINIFVGPSDPGLAMDPSTDLWANRDVTTLDEVVAAVSDTGSALSAAVRNAQQGSRLFLSASQFAPVDNRPAQLGPMFSSDAAYGVSVCTFSAGSQVNLAGVLVATPPGWSRLRVRLLWSTTAASTGNVRWGCYCNELAVGASVVMSSSSNVQLTAAAPASNVVAETIFTTNTTVNPAGDCVRVTFARVSSNAEDTLDADALLLGAIVERME